MDKVAQINIKQDLYEKEFLNSRFEFNISGNDIDHIIVNTIRRICLTSIPIYIFHKFLEQNKNLKM